MTENEILQKAAQAYVRARQRTADAAAALERATREVAAAETELERTTQRLGQCVKAGSRATVVVMLGAHTARVVTVTATHADAAAISIDEPLVVPLPRYVAGEAVAP